MTAPLSSRSLVSYLGVGLLASFASAQNFSSLSCGVQNPIVDSSYPTAWQSAATGPLTSAEYQAFNKTIDWTKVPNIAVKNASTINTYNVAADPDCWWSASGCTTGKLAGLKADVTSCPEPGTLGLTFDDGPNCTEPAFYDFLKSQNQLATLFFIGSNVMDWPAQAQRAFKDGHHIAIHTWSHPQLTFQSNDAVAAELFYSRKIIKQVLGITPKYFRPPQGDIDDRVRAIASQMGLTSIQWILDSNDWQMMPAGTLTSAQVDSYFQSWLDKVANGTFARSGAINLEHELNEGTMTKAVTWYPKIKAAFTHVTNVATCLNETHPYTETNVTMATFADFIKNPNATGGQSSSTSTATGQTSFSSALFTYTTAVFSTLTAILAALVGAF